MKYIGLVVAVAVTGCGALPNVGGSGPKSAAPEACNAGAYQGLIGLDAASSLAIPEPKRDYIVGSAVTTDFVPERVNIQLDETDTIVAITCG